MMRLTPERFVDRLERDQVTRFAWVVLMRSGVVPTGEREDDRKRREELFEIFASNRSEFFDTIIYLLRYALGVNDFRVDDEDTKWNSMLNLVRIMGTLKTAQWSKKMLRDMSYDDDDELHVPR
ncbi:hypothetical protein QBC32DRAFT_175737, partial [Pseudoneurospora amorphoporcata]